jgi:hypothetical protein
VTVFGIHRAQFSQPILKSAGIFSEMGNQLSVAAQWHHQLCLMMADARYGGW